MRKRKILMEIIRSAEEEGDNDETLEEDEDDDGDNEDRDPEKNGCNNYA